jgi:uncharacterized membrane protein YkvA (DUF1232 family)
MTHDTEKRARAAESEAQKIVEDPATVDQFAVKAADKVRRNSSRLGSVKKDFNTMIRMMRAWARGQYKGMSLSSIVIVIGAVIYFVNPIDAVADFLPFIGFSDDVAVIALAIARLKNEFQKFEEWEKTVDVDPS